MANFACPPAPMTTLSLNEVPPPHRVETGASEEATRWGFPRCRSPPGPPGTGTPENSPANWPAIHSRHSSTPFGGRARGRPQVPPHSTRWKKYAGGWKNLPCIETPSPGASRRRRRDGAPARPNRPPRAVPYPRPACPVNDPKTRRECHPDDPERRRCKSSPDSPRPPRCQTGRRTNARQSPTLAISAPLFRKRPGEINRNRLAHPAAFTEAGQQFMLGNQRVQPRKGRHHPPLDQGLLQRSLKIANDSRWHLGRRGDGAAVAVDGGRVPPARRLRIVHEPQQQRQRNDMPALGIGKKVPDAFAPLLRDAVILGKVVKVVLHRSLEHRHPFPALLSSQDAQAVHPSGPRLRTSHAENSPVRFLRLAISRAVPSPGSGLSSRYSSSQNLSATPDLTRGSGTG